MTNAIVKHELSNGVWGTILAVAPTMKDSRLFGVATEAQAAAIMAKGYELGLGLTTSFEFINVIENKPTLTPRGALAIVQQSGLLESMKIDERRDKNGKPESCSVTLKRAGGFEYTATFSMADAAQAGIVKPGGAWEKYPSNMLRWRAIGYAIDVVFPDVTGGMKRADEFGATVDAAGNVVDATYTIAEPTPAPVPTVVVEPAAPTLQSLVAEYGAAAVMAANNGKIPASDSEVAAVAKALAVGSDAQ